jgi:hypothetical protein
MAKFLLRLTIYSILMTSIGAGCRPEPVSTNIDIDLRDPVITLLSGGSRQLDFTIVVTQLGNYFFRPFYFELKKLGGQQQVLDTYMYTLPSAREFVYRSVIVPGPGDYFVTAGVGTETSGGSSGTLVKVP